VTKNSHIMRSCRICTPHHILLRLTNQGGYCMHCAEMYTRFWLGNMTERDHFEDPNIDVKKIRKLNFKK